MSHKKCPYCSSLKTIKKGSNDHGQRYLCKECKRRFRLKNYIKKQDDHYWNEYVFHKQTVRELLDDYEVTKDTLREYFHTYQVSEKFHTPRHVVLVVDTTFFGKKETGQLGVTVFRDAKKKENLWWEFVDQEVCAVYTKGKRYLEDLGYTWDSITCDGLTGLTNVFKGFPVQFCQFHQIQIVRRYVTQNPKLEAGKDLLVVVKQLPHISENNFKKLLDEYITKHRDFLNERTYNPFTEKEPYTHLRLRSAVASLQKNLPLLFTFRKYPHLYIPNTTNTLEGHFSHIKDIVRIHRGMKKTLKEKVVTAILLNSSIVLSKTKRPKN